MMSGCYIEAQTMDTEDLATETAGRSLRVGLRYHGVTLEGTDEVL